MAYAYGLLCDHALAEDVVQNAYVALSKKYDTVTGNSILAWCRGAVRIEALRILRTIGREQSTGETFFFDAVSDAFEQEQTPDGTAMKLEQLDRLKTCYEELPPRSQELIGNRYLDGMDLSEVGQKMGMKKDAVRKSLYRIRLLLRECMNRRQVVV